jgi:hypothetical protein
MPKRITGFSNPPMNSEKPNVTKVHLTLPTETYNLIQIEAARKTVEYCSKEIFIPVTANDLIRDIIRKDVHKDEDDADWAMKEPMNLANFCNFIDLAIRKHGSLVVYVKMPDLNAFEEIRNPLENLEVKKAYYQTAYNYDMQLKSFPAIQIVGARIIL